MSQPHGFLFHFYFTGLFVAGAEAGEAEKLVPIPAEEKKQGGEEFTVELERKDLVANLDDHGLTLDDFRNFGVRPEPTSDEESTVDEEEFVFLDKEREVLEFVSIYMIPLIVSNEDRKRAERNQKHIKLMEWATVSDVSFAILVMDNYYHKWRQMAQYELDHNKKAKMPSSEIRSLLGVRFSSGNCLSSHMAQERLLEISKRVMDIKLHDALDVDEYWDKYKSAYPNRKNNNSPCEKSTPPTSDDEDSESADEEIDPLQKALNDEMLASLGITQSIYAV